MSPLRGFSVRLMMAFYEDVAPTGLCLVMAKAEGVIRSTQPHAEAWG
ncbi:MAG: hypothetical protein J0L94_16045 [Rhodothermia bacterium]|nr:hypothetical protein [Rhodothermia bacterium]